MAIFFESQRRTPHRETWDLLPWLVNGTLNDVQARRCEQHMEECEACRIEFQDQQTLRRELQAGESVLHTPHGALRKLMSRMDEEALAPTAEPTVQLRESRRMRWLAAAVVVQTVGLIALAAFMSWRLNQVRAEPRYATLSSMAAISPTGPGARVVFSTSLSLAEFAALLRSYDAQIVAGPSEAGVYTLVFPHAADRQAVAAAVTRLRDHPQVRFAEFAEGGTPR